MVKSGIVGGTYTYIQETTQSYVEVFLPLPDGFSSNNTSVTIAPITLHGAGFFLYQASFVTETPHTIRLRFRTLDMISIPAGTPVAFHYQFVKTY